MLLYSIGSCGAPMPGRPATANAPLSLPPSTRADDDDAPKTPQSSNGLRNCASTMPASGGPKIVRAAHAARAVVDVPVARRAWRSPAVGASADAEVPLDVVERSEQSLFFAAPERDADRAARLRADGLQDARGLQHDRAADRVVGRAGRARPRVEMAAEHHDFVGFVGAGESRRPYVGRLALREVLVLTTLNSTDTGVPSAMMRKMRP